MKQIQRGAVGKTHEPILATKNKLFFFDHFLTFQDNSVLHVRWKNKFVAFPSTLVRVSVESANKLHHNRFISLRVFKFLDELWDSTLTRGRYFALVIASHTRCVIVWERKCLKNFNSSKIVCFLLPVWLHFFFTAFLYVCFMSPFPQPDLLL